MTYLRFRRRTRVRTRIQTSNLMATLYCMEHVPIAETLIQILIYTEAWFIRNVFCAVFLTLLKWVEYIPMVL